MIYIGRIIVGLEHFFHYTLDFFNYTTVKKAFCQNNQLVKLIEITNTEKGKQENFYNCPKYNIIYFINLILL